MITTESLSLDIVFSAEMLLLLLLMSWFCAGGVTGRPEGHSHSAALNNIRTFAHKNPLEAADKVHVKVYFESKCPACRSQLLYICVHVC